VSIVSGGIYAGASVQQIEQLRSFGSNAGLAFQIVDDVLDVTQSSAALGKTAGKDTATQKATWPAVFGVERSSAMAEELITGAFESLQSFGAAADSLKAVANYLVTRKS
jgi:geranylgeranyl diphosphate synthase type II